MTEEPVPSKENAQEHQSSHGSLPDYRIPDTYYVLQSYTYRVQDIRLHGGRINIQAGSIIDGTASNHLKERVIDVIQSARYTVRDVERKLKRSGWKATRQKGSHRIWSHDGRDENISLPVHTGDISLGVIHGIRTIMGLSKDAFHAL